MSYYINELSLLPCTPCAHHNHAHSGLSVLDLGSGSGRDCYAAAALVGESGRVTGVDMTAEQLVTARKYNESFCKDLGHKTCNLEFIEGYIEKLADAGNRVRTKEKFRARACVCV